MCVKVNMSYFTKNGKVHKFPAPLECTVNREGERLYGSIPREIEPCPDCFREEERRERGHE